MKKDKVKVDSTAEPEVVTIEKEIANGKNEYAISGWVRWSDIPNIGAWHLLYRVTCYDKDFLTDMTKFGDRTLAMWKGLGFYH